MLASNFCDGLASNSANLQAYRCRARRVEPVAAEAKNVAPGKLLKELSSTA